MHIMDLVLQGVRRFGESRKFAFKPGFNVVLGTTESGKSTLVACLLDLLYPDRVREDELTLVSWGEPATSRAGLTVSSGRDTYRILKDFQTHNIGLTQYNPASQKFEPVASDAAHVASVLSSAFDLPPFDLYHTLFITDADQMPSALPLTPEESPEAEMASGPDGPRGTAINPGQQGMVPGPGIPGMMPPGAPPGPGIPGMMPPGAPPGPGIPGMMPGAMPPGMVPGQSMPGMPGMMGTMMPDDGLTPEEREKKVVQLRSELADMKKVEEIQYEIDGHQQKVFEIEAKTKTSIQFDEFLEEAKQQLDIYPVFRRLPKNIDERLEGYDDLHSKQGQEVEKVDRVAVEFDNEYNLVTAQPPIQQQTLAQVGAGLLVGGIVAFLVYQYTKIDILKFVGFLSIPGVLLVAYEAWHALERASKASEAETKLEELDEKRNTIIKRYEVEMAVIDKLMKDSDSDALQELQNKIEKYRELDDRYQSILQKKNKVVKDLNLPKLEKEDKELKAKIEALENELRKYPAFSMDPNEMKKEIEKLEGAIKQTNPDSAALNDGGGAQKVPEPTGEGFGVPTFGAPPSAPADAGGTVIKAPAESGATAMVSRKTKILTASQAYEQLLRSSGRLLEIERNKLIQNIQQRFNLYTQAFTVKRNTDARIEPDGSVALKSADGGRWVDFEHMTPAARDTIYLALQITLLELAIQKRNLPVILDNPATRLDETAAVVAAKALKRVGQQTQVVLLSTQRTPIQYADHSVNLT